MKKAPVKILKKPDLTVISFLLDESGSMGSCYGPTIEGYNTYIDQLKASPDSNKVLFTLTKFEGGKVEVVHN